MFLEGANARVDLVRRHRRLSHAPATALSLVLCSIAAACGSASQSITAPGGVKCAVGASVETTSFGAGGGSGAVRVTTNRECRWTASTSGAWIQLNGGKEGQGDAQIPFSVSANPDPAERRGAILVADKQIAIAQEPAACRFTVSPLAATVPAAGERRAIEVQANGAQCAWTARSDRDWLVVLEGSEHTGSGRVVYEARATSGPTRSGTIRVGDQIVMITQTAGCSFSISPRDQSVPASVAHGTVSVTTAAGCAWNASSQAPWISIDSGANGSGAGQVAYTVLANSGPERIGTLTIAGIAHTVTQSAACSYSIDPASQSFDAGGGTGSVAVSAGAGCSWTAVSSEGWVQVTGGGSGTGSGTVGFAVEQNTGPARSATIFIAGLSFSVQQASGCTFALSAPGQTYDAAAHNDSVSVMTAGGCTWNATSSADWIVITAGTSGNGAGRIEFSVAANPGAARSGAITVGGQTFTIAQTGA